MNFYIAPQINSFRQVVYREQALRRVEWITKWRSSCRSSYWWCTSKGSTLLANLFSLFNSMKNLHMVVWILGIVGGLNWLLIGLGGFMGSNWNVVGMIFGSWPQVEWIVYILVGLSAVYELVSHKGNCRNCGSGGGM